MRSCPLLLLMDTTCWSGWGVLLGGEFCFQPNVPGQQLCDAVDRVVGAALQYLSQVGLGIEAVQFGRPGEAMEGRGACPTAVGPVDKEILTTDSNRKTSPGAGLVCI